VVEILEAKRTNAEIRAVENASRLQTIREICRTPFDGYGLTDRQMECAGLAARGFTWDEIGDKMGLSPNTVKKHLKAASDKIGVPSRQFADVMLRQIEAVVSVDGVLKS